MPRGCVGRIPFKNVERRLSGQDTPLTTLVHSRRMASVRQQATAPERVVRGILTDLGLRYRTKNRDLAGSPDLANRTRRWAVFVHGCFWHRHARCAKATMPKTNQAFWAAKFARNIERDEAAGRALRKLGFEVIIVWECEVRDVARVRKRLATLGAVASQSAYGASAKPKRY